MSRLIVVIFFLANTVTASAQYYKNGNPLRNLPKIDVGFQGIGFTYEARHNNKTTIDLSAGIGGGYDAYEVVSIIHYRFFNQLFIFPLHLNFIIT